MGATNSILLVTLGAADVTKLRREQDMVSLMVEMVKCSGIRPIGRVLSTSYPIQKVKGKYISDIGPVIASQKLETGMVTLATSPSEGLVEISIMSHEPFKMDKLELALAPYSEWAWLVDVLWMKKDDGAWVLRTEADTERKAK